eukprot:gnl/TRDRNA2_/TRDRNA2_188293_c0_seq1.p1 gnl/TRDRNA2_/TRDRNA2_188293_c0~~gnl/TRDRNA2_/TRDRNA2_188293_c0_seq1.p1  ORF type:complete len:313 (+),score=35.74 gnl/TRDRNA2_/TRDRNA2_188293_c0_seq1:74-1012(+)
MAVYNIKRDQSFFTSTMAGFASQDRDIVSLENGEFRELQETPRPVALMSANSMSDRFGSTKSGAYGGVAEAGSMNLAPSASSMHSRQPSMPAFQQPQMPSFRMPFQQGSPLTAAPPQPRWTTPPPVPSRGVTPKREHERQPQPWQQPQPMPRSVSLAPAPMPRSLSLEPAPPARTQQQPLPRPPVQPEPQAQQRTGAMHAMRQQTPASQRQPPYEEQSRSLTHQPSVHEIQKRMNSRGSAPQAPRQLENFVDYSAPASNGVTPHQANGTVPSATPSTRASYAAAPAPLSRDRDVSVDETDYDHDFFFCDCRI